MKLPLVLTLLTFFLLSACSKEDTDANSTKNTIYQKEIETLNQAKQLQQQLNEQTQQTEQRMDELNRQ